jgi:GAF domain-containing protein
LISDYEFANTEYEDGKQWVAEHNVNSVIGAPLMSGETVLGTIMIGHTKEFTYSLQDEALLLSISSLLASTLDNRQLFQQIQRRSTQLETSAEVSRIASTILDANELLPEVVELIRTGFDLYYAGIFLVDETGQFSGEPEKWAVLRAGTGTAGQEMMEAGHKLEVAGSSMIGTAITKAEAQISLEVGEEDDRFRNPALPDTRSEMALPLRSRGHVLGAISIQSDQEAAFSQEDVTSLQTMADQLANAIENARLFEQTEERAKELLVLNNMARAYTQTMDVETLFEQTFIYTNRLLYAENFYLALYNDEDNTIDFRLFTEDGEQITPPEPQIILGEGLTDWIILNKVPVLIPRDVEKDLETMGLPHRGKMANAYLGVPMMIGRDVIGVIAIQSYEPDQTYTERDLDLLTAISSQAAVAIDNALRFQQTQARAQFEQVLREITTRVHSTSDPEAILKTAVREVSQALGREAFIELAAEESDEDTVIPLPQDEKPDDPINPKTQPISKQHRDEE